jgi:hypothetical protein
MERVELRFERRVAFARDDERTRRQTEEAVFDVRTLWVGDRFLEAENNERIGRIRRRNRRQRGERRQAQQDEKQTPTHG